MLAEHFSHKRKVRPLIGPGQAIPRDGVFLLSPDRIGMGALAEAEWAALGLDAPDLDAMRAHRLARVRERLERGGFAAALLYDPVNIRYATDATNMQIWTMHNAVRYAFVAANGPLILFDFHGGAHLADHLPLVNESRPATPMFYMGYGDRGDEVSARWADEIADLLREHAGGEWRLAVDRLPMAAIAALEARGVELGDGEALMERARSVKGPDEIKAMRRAVAACEAAMRAMEAALEPQITETRLWSILHAENIARGGEWIETRLLASGPRTNPWFQECMGREIEAGDLVAFDTDLVGAYGYCCDISRTWLCGDGRPSNEQRALYQTARDQIESNAALLRPGLGYLEFSYKAKSLPEDCLANRYSVLAHGVGLCDEHPAIVYPEDVPATGYDGVFEPGAVVCVESYVGREGGREGVKLEDQYLITETGAERLSTYPWDERLSG